MMQKSSMILKSLPFGGRILPQVQSLGNPFHSLAPGLTTLSPSLSSSPAAASCQNSTTHRSLFYLSANSHAKLCSDNDFSLAKRCFSMSTLRAAKESSEKGDVVYKGAISGMIKGVKLFSVSTSVIGLCLQPMIFMNNEALPTGLKVVFGGIINFFVFLNPIIIHYIAKKYVTELRWNSLTGVFTAVTLNLFVQRKELQFKAEDVRVPDVPGMFTFLEAKGTPLFLDPHGFEDEEAYIHLMGFNKPLDWELPPREQQPESQEKSHKR